MRRSLRLLFFRGYCVKKSASSWSINKFLRPNDASLSKHVVDQDLVRKLSVLSRVRVEDSDKLIADLEEIYHCLELIKEVDTTNVQPLISPLEIHDNLDITCPMQADEPSETPELSDLLDNAKIKRGAFFIAPLGN
eukprot:TRINITY_DN22339_c0_g1_i1.p1 TRINITY_DN22339_c0_g1~~TRINITY_DN22339_c0_g1_i1.p1  ORF type:complete len:146 (+),score=17.56 TRINITY_DN22339_c0_g1_i1:31-438(+)